MIYKEKNVLTIEVRKSSRAPRVLMTLCSSQEMDYMTSSIVNADIIGWTASMPEKEKELFNCSEWKSKYSENSGSFLGETNAYQTCQK